MAEIKTSTETNSKIHKTIAIVFIVIEVLYLVIWMLMILRTLWGYFNYKQNPDSTFDPKEVIVFSVITCGYVIGFIVATLTISRKISKSKEIKYLTFKLLMIFTLMILPAVFGLTHLDDMRNLILLFYI